MRANQLDSVKGSLLKDDSYMVQLTFIVSNKNDSGLNEFMRLNGIVNRKNPVDISIKEIL